MDSFIRACAIVTFFAVLAAVEALAEADAVLAPTSAHVAEVAAAGAYSGPSGHRIELLSPLVRRGRLDVLVDAGSVHVSDPVVPDGRYTRPDGTTILLEKGIIIVGGRPTAGAPPRPMQGDGHGLFESWTLGDPSGLELISAFGVVSPHRRYVLEGLIELGYVGSLGMPPETERHQPRMRIHADWFAERSYAVERIELTGGVTGTAEARFQCDRDPWSDHAALCQLWSVRQTSDAGREITWQQIYDDRFERPIGAGRFTLDEARAVEAKGVERGKTFARSVGRVPRAAGAPADARVANERVRPVATPGESDTRAESEHAKRSRTSTVEAPRPEAREIRRSSSMPLATDLER